MGVLGYMQGDGRFGVFEILKHLVPGLVIDILWPLVRRLPRSVFILCVLGFLTAIARTSTEFVTMLLLGSRLEAYAFPLAKLLPNIVAGTLSGCVMYFVLPAFEKMRANTGVTSESVALPGEELSATIIKEGGDDAQGVAYVPDGITKVDLNDTADTLNRRSGRAGGEDRGGGHGGGGGG